MTRKKKSAREAALGAAALGAAVLILLSPAEAAEYAGRGLSLCARTVIPSLFPLMVLSGYLMRAGLGTRLGRLCERPMRALFGVGGAGASAILLGALCGFPVGAQSVCALVERGELSRREGGRVLSVCNFPSPAFLLSTVGASLFGSVRAGLCAALSVWGAGLLCGAAGRFLSPVGAETCTSAAVPPARSGASHLTEAVRAAADGMVGVCAYVVFFSALTGCLAARLPAGPGVAVRCFFELTDGVCAVSALPDRRMGLILAAAAAGWSGISVHLQVASAAGGRVPLGPYAAAKAAQAALAALLCTALTALFPSFLPPAAAGIPTAGTSFPAGVWAALPGGWTAAVDALFLWTAASRPLRR